MTSSSMTGAKVGRLLIVDDDEGVTQTFAGLLRLEGYQVSTAKNAHEGLSQVEAFGPDAIILDLRMPLVNGMGFLYRLRERIPERTIPITIVTADVPPSDDVLTEMKDLGADIHFKPIWSDELNVIAERLLSRSAAASRPHSS